ncbi:hypothetical protein ZTR_04808 [Talaromyces verruculosus]|nr:hypothetical protein ZTR_04808 [Talaromyces verruculosus]
MHPVQARNMMAQQQMQMNQMNEMQMRNQRMMGGAQVGFGRTNLITGGVKRIIRHHVLSLSNANLIGDVTGYNVFGAGT